MTAEAAAMYPAWAHSAEEVLLNFGVDPRNGLSNAEVEKRREQYGYNEFEHEPPVPLWRLVLQQFDDTLVKVLILAAGISFALAWFEEGGDDPNARLRAFMEPGVIVLILVLNAAVGVWQESNAESALEALKEMSADTAKVWRDGALVSALPCRELVPGDVVELHTGDRVPADVRLTRLHTAVLRAEQSALTGESAAVCKSAAAVCKSADCELQAKECVLFGGTGVASGSATAVVHATGMSTEMGLIQRQIREAAAEDSDTPLKQMLDSFGESLARLILWVCVAVWLINWRHFLSWETRPGSAFLPDWSTVTFSLDKATFYFKVAVALAVAAIPEGLPAVITTCLALGTRKMAQRRAIVRHLPSVETLGCTTVICSDKTGTLTTNQMAAAALLVLDRQGRSLRRYDVSGTTYDPRDGGVEGLAKELSRGGAWANVRAAAQVALLCNGARLERRDGHVQAVGQATEAALLVLAEKVALAERDAGAALAESPADEGEADSMADESLAAFGARSPLEASRTYALAHRKLDTLEFDRDRKSMSVVVRERGALREDGRAPEAAGLAARVTRSSSRSQRAQEPAGNQLLVKGAGECVLERCSHALLPGGEVVPLGATARAEIRAGLDALAERALRVLVLAVRRALPEPLSSYDGSEAHAGHALLAEPEGYGTLESGLAFAGLVGLQDPPRPEVPGAIAACHRAGVRVMVITGDNKLTAEAICRSIGVFRRARAAKGEDEALTPRASGERAEEEEEAGLSPRASALLEGSWDAAQERRLMASQDWSLTGLEFVRLSPGAQARLLASRRGVCISRAEPGHKLEVVRRLRARGEVVAMTGDGVNDAPALKLADIGVAMGIAGTEVAKEAADMVLADDNFATVVAAVEEGRAIYANMKAFIRYMISSNIGEVASIFLAAALGLPEGLLPVQLLWVNLVTDGPPATALGFNPPDPDTMRRPPRRAGDHFITPWLLVRWLVVGAYVGVATVGIFAVWFTRTSFLGLDFGADGHRPVTLSQLQNWEACRRWEDFDPGRSYAVQGGGEVRWDQACEVFTVGKAKASTLSLSVLVAIEMFNAANALSEDTSLVRMPVWRNPWLLLAMVVSFGLHAVILYVPFFASTFSIVPLSAQEWGLVLLFALPVIAIDEVLKFMGRRWFAKKTELQAAPKLKEE